MVGERCGRWVRQLFIEAARFARFDQPELGMAGGTSALALPTSGRGEEMT